MNAKPNCVAIIQGRMSASRLPGKVLLDLCGQPMLARVVERVRRATCVDEVIVATTTDPADDTVAEFCHQRGYACFRGDQYDVLDRYYQAALTTQADCVVRITADCPLIDPHLIERTVDELQQAGADFAANRLPPPWHRTYPIGLDVEACTFASLERAWKEADQPHQREHVMPFFYEGIPVIETATTQPVTSFQSPRGFWVVYLNHSQDYGSLRWTVDTPKDLELVRQVYQHFGGSDHFSWSEVLELFLRQPHLAEINAAVQHKVYNDLDQRRK